MFGMIPFDTPGIRKPSPEDLMETDFIYYAAKLGATEDQIESAYFHLCKTDESEITDPVVSKLYQEMDRLARNRYPINRFVRMIDKRREIEKMDKRTEEGEK